MDYNSLWILVNDGKKIISPNKQSLIWVKVRYNFYRGLYRVVIFTNGDEFSPSFVECEIFFSWSADTNKVTLNKKYGTYYLKEIAIESVSTNWCLYLKVYTDYSGETPHIMIGEERYNDLRPQYNLDEIDRLPEGCRTYNII